MKLKDLSVSFRLKTYLVFFFQNFLDERLMSAVEFMRLKTNLLFSEFMI